MNCDPLLLWFLGPCLRWIGPAVGHSVFTPDGNGGRHLAHTLAYDIETKLDGILGAVLRDLDHELIMDECHHPARQLSCSPCGSTGCALTGTPRTLDSKEQALNHLQQAHLNLSYYVQSTPRSGGCGQSKCRRYIDLAL